MLFIFKWALWDQCFVEKSFKQEGWVKGCSYKDKQAGCGLQEKGNLLVQGDWHRMQKESSVVDINVIMACKLNNKVTSPIPWLYLPDIYLLLSTVASSE